MEERTKTIRKQRIGVDMFFKFVIVYLLLFVSYLAYIIAHSTTDHLHATTAFIGALGSFLIGVITAFVNIQSDKANIAKLETDTEVE